MDILKIHSRKMNLTRGINLRKIAETMPGASGAEVKGVCTEAGMYALRERRVHVTQEDFEMAVAKVRALFLTAYYSLSILFSFIILLNYPYSILGDAERLRKEHVYQKIMEITYCVLSYCYLIKYQYNFQLCLLSLSQPPGIINKEVLYILGGVYMKGVLKSFKLKINDLINDTCN